MTHAPGCDCDFCFTDDLNAVLRRFLEQREKGRPPVDPDAEQLAREVRDVVAEMDREDAA